MTDKEYIRGKKKTLTKLNIREISGVDVPAQGLATVKLIKRNESRKDTLMGLEQQIEQLQKQLADQIAKTEELEKKYEADKEEETKKMEEKAKKMEAEKARMEEEKKKKELEEAEKALAKAKGEDHKPVLYKSVAGIEYRDSAQAELAKQNDSLAQKLAKIEDLNKRVELEKRAGELCKHLKGSDDIKVALVKAIEGIESDELRKGVEELVKVADAAMSDLFKSRGTTATADDANEPIALLEKKARDYQAKNADMSYEQAFNVVSQTQEGRELLAKTRKRPQ